MYIASSPTSASESGKLQLWNLEKFLCTIPRHLCTRYPPVVHRVMHRDSHAGVRAVVNDLSLWSGTTRTSLSTQRAEESAGMLSCRPGHAKGPASEYESFDGPFQ